MANTLIKLAGLFECESKAGNRYFTGLINSGAKLVMLENKRHQADNEPHWLLYVGGHPVERLKHRISRVRRYTRVSRMGRRCRTDCSFRVLATHAA